MKKKRDYSKDKDCLSWLSTTDRTLSRSALSAIEARVRKEVEILKTLSAKDRLLYQKKDELDRWLPTQTQKDLLWVERNIFKIRGKSDFRRMDPELVEVTDDFELQTLNIWGEPEVTSIKSNDAHSTHWDILRTLVSTATNDGFVGRRIRYIVIDKTTKSYLGVICISSAMFRTKAIHEEIGWKAEEVKKRGAKSGKPGLHNLANGQTIVAVQPFGGALLGGKLLSLLCISDRVVSDWYRRYGDRLVGVHTTSLYGTGNNTQYDNLTPYWRRLGETSGEESLRLTPGTYELVKQWILNKYPQKYYRLFVEKNEKNMLVTRESKSEALPFAYKNMGIENTVSKEPRGVYSSMLYTNSVDFLNERIGEDQLIPAFDNSVDALTNFWRFGSMGDTTKPTDEIRKKAKTPDKIRMKIKQKSMVKGRIGGLNAPMKVENEWYLPMKDLTWDEIRVRYSDQSA